MLSRARSAPSVEATKVECCFTFCPAGTASTWRLGRAGWKQGRTRHRAHAMPSAVFFVRCILDIVVLRCLYHSRGRATSAAVPGRTSYSGAAIKSQLVPEHRRAFSEYSAARLRISCCCGGGGSVYVDESVKRTRIRSGPATTASPERPRSLRGCAVAAQGWSRGHAPTSSASSSARRHELGVRVSKSGGRGPCARSGRWGVHGGRISSGLALTGRWCSA